MVDNEKDKNSSEEGGNIGSFYMGRMRPPPEPKRLLPPGMLTLIALSALAGIVWYAYPRGAEKYTNVDVPLVKADTAPIKAKPADPGGMEVRHQDSTVFDPLEKKPGAEVEKLLPTPEEPMDKDEIKAVEAKPPQPPSELPPKLDVQMKDAGNGAEKVVPKVDETVKAAPPAPVTGPAVAAVPPPKVEDMKIAAPALPAPAAEAATTPLPAPYEPPRVENMKVASAAPLPKADVMKADVQKHEDEAQDNSGSSDTQYEVQLGSYREMDDAKKDWDRLKKKYAAYLGDLKMRLVKADIPVKGTYYRLQAGAISKDRAHEICDALKTSNRVGCILAKW